MSAAVTSTFSDHDLLARLVEFDSVSDRPERPIAEYVCSYLDRPGIDVEHQDSPDGSRLNVLARVGPARARDRKGLVLSGHLDVVPADEPGWQTDPFRLQERSGRLYGRGACDMKGSVALAMNIAVEAAATDLRHPLVLLFSYDEELGSLGAQHFCAAREDGDALPRRAVIGEPTSLRAVRMHKGHLKIRVTVEGRAAHSGTPHLGRNAIERAGDVLAVLRSVRRDLESERVVTSAFFEDVPYPVLNVGRIRGGDAVNVVPDRCTIDLGVRLLPGQDSGPVIERLATEIMAAAGPDADQPARVEVMNENPPMLLDESSDLYGSFRTLLDQDASFGVSFASDAGVLQRDLGIDCVLFGPGSMDVAHKPNEYVPIDELARARETLAALVKLQCIV